MGGRGKREKKAVQKVPVRNLPKIVSKGGKDGETEISKGRGRVRTSRSEGGVGSAYN